MNQERTYCGLENEVQGGMTATGNLIRDAWVFGFIPESETCKGWNQAQIQQLYDKVYEEWSKYGHMVSELPEELKKKHGQIYDNAIKIAKEKGWDPELEDDD